MTAHLRSPLLIVPLLFLTQGFAQPVTPPTLTSKLSSCDFFQKDYVPSGNWLIFRDDLTSKEQAPVEIQPDLKRFALALKSQGIQPLIIPVPSRSQIYADQVDPMTLQALQYDPRAARIAYLTSVKILDGLGFPTVNLYDGLFTNRVSPSGETAFFITDHHWTPLGAKVAARLVADRLIGLGGEYAAIPKTMFTTRLAYVNQQTGYYGQQIQQACKVDVALEPENVYETRAVGEPDAGPLGDAIRPVVLVGTSYSNRGENSYNFDGALEESLGVGIMNRGLSGPRSYISLESYLLSDTYVAARPKYLLWQYRATSTLKDLADPTALRRVIPAAYGLCQKPLTTGSLSSPLNIVASAAGHRFYLWAQATSPLPPKFTVTFGYTDGKSETVPVVRSDPLKTNTRFALELSDAYTSNLTSVALTGVIGGVTGSLCAVP